jgi:hypothetical protein
MKNTTISSRVENSSTEKAWDWLARASPVFLALAFTPQLVPGEFVELATVPLFALRALIMLGVGVFILILFCGTLVLSLNVSRPQSAWLAWFERWQARLSISFLLLFAPPWTLIMSWVWLAELMST